jgi:hypothetical protein
MEPHPDRDEQPDSRPSSRSGVVAAVVIGALLLIIVALHLTTGFSPHGR